VNQLQTAAANAGSGAPGSEPSKGLKTLMKLSGIASESNKDPGLEFGHGDGELKLGIAERMLKWHAEAVGRMVELSVPSDV
jgi:exocyst complex component 5